MHASDGRGAGYMDYRIAVPHEFGEVFSHFYVARNGTDNTVRKTLLPSYRTILVFGFGARALLHTADGSRFELDKCLVLGPIRRAFDYSLPAQSCILVANFKGDAFYRFFGTASIGHLPLDPDSLLEENCFTALWQQLDKIEDPEDQADHVLAYCRPYLGPSDSRTGQLAAFKDAAFNPVKVVAAAEQQSERSIQLHHKKRLGYSAKEISRYQRFVKAVGLIQDVIGRGLKVNWFEIIDRCGYYDQSQLIHDFRHYINLSPTRYVKLQQNICNPGE